MAVKTRRVVVSARIFLGALLLLALEKAESAPLYLRYPFLPGQGEPRLLVILVETPDRPAVTPPESFERLFFSRADDGVVSAAEYYQEVSYGKLKLRGRVTPWLKLGRTMPEYAAGSYGRSVLKFPNNLGGFAQEAIQAALAAGIDFTPYDNHGDGQVDGLVIIHSGPDAARSRDTSQLWSRLDYISMYDQAPMTAQGLLLDRFVVCPEFPKTPQDLSPHTYVHELGHALGWPDQYDPDYSSAGIGALGLMGWALPGDDHKIPLAPEAYSRALLDWIAPREIKGDTVAVLHSIALAPEALKINTTFSGEYFLLSFQTAFAKNSRLWGDGFLLFHANDRAIYGNRFECRGPCELGPRLAVVQADGRSDLEQKKRPADPEDFFPGPLKVLAAGADTGNAQDPFLGATTLSYQGWPTGIRFHDFQVFADHGQVGIAVGDAAAPGRDQPLLKIAETKWEELSGNGNSFAEPGEKLRLRVTIVNLGREARGISLKAGAEGLSFDREIKIAHIAAGEKIEVGFYAMVLKEGQGQARRILASAFTDAPEEPAVPGEGNGPVKAAAPSSLTLPPSWSSPWSRLEIKAVIQQPAAKVLLSSELVLGAPLLMIVGDAPHDLIPYCRWAADYWKLTLVSRDVLTQGLPAPKEIAAPPLVLWLSGVRTLDGNKYPDDQRLELFRAVISAGHTLILSAGMIREPLPQSTLDLLGLSGLEPAAGLSLAKGQNQETPGRDFFLGLRSPYYPNLTPHLIPQPGAGAKILLTDLWNRPTSISSSPFKHTPGRIIFLGFPYEALDRGSAVELIAEIINRLKFSE